MLRLDRDKKLLGFLDPDALRHVLKRLADQRWLRRLERGAYVVAGPGRTETRSQLALIADWLEGEPYLVTGFFALAHWNLTGHPPTAVDVLLARRKANVRYGQTLFRFIYTARTAFGPAQEVRVVGARALAQVASPERTLAYVLAGRHAVSLDVASEAFERGLRYGVLHRGKLLAAAREAPSAALRRLGWIAERHEDALAAQLRSFVGSEGYVPLDPRASAARAELNRRWRLVENAEVTA